MGTDIASGVSGPTPDAVQPSPRDSGLAGPTPIASTPSPADQMPARDLTGERLSQLAGYEQDIGAAQAAAMAAEDGRRQHYAQDILPQGAAYGDTMNLPPVPEDAVPPTGDFLFGQGDQPGR